MPHRDIELHLHPRDPRGRIRSLRLRPRTARRLAALLVVLVLFVVAGLAAAPRGLRIRLSARDYRAGVALRQELGERLQAMLARLDDLARRGDDLARLTGRIERLYGIEASASGGEAPSESSGAPGGSRGAGGSVASAAPSLAPAAPATIFAAQIAAGNRTERGLTADLDGVARSLARLSAFEREHPEQASAMPVGAPLPPDRMVLSGAYGPRRSPYTGELEFHSGLEFAAPRGTPIVAPADGVVVFTGAVAPAPHSEWWRLGRVVVLRHGDRFRTVLGHFDDIDVRPGERVKARQRLGTVGESGWTTSPNLHYEIRRREGDAWVPVDPADYMLGVAIDAKPRPPARVDDPEPQEMPRLFAR